MQAENSMYSMALCRSVRGDQLATLTMTNFPPIWKPRESLAARHATWGRSWDWDIEARPMTTLEKTFLFSCTCSADSPRSRASLSLTFRVRRVGRSHNLQFPPFSRVVAVFDDKRCRVRQQWDKLQSKGFLVGNLIFWMDFNERKLERWAIGAGMNCHVKWVKPDERFRSLCVIQGD